MHKLLIILLFAVFYSCQSKPEPQKDPSSSPNTNTTAMDSNSNQKMKNIKIIGERIDGPANIRDGINGKLLFSLDNDVLVSCTSLDNNWYRVGVRMDLPQEGGDIRRVNAGKKIIVDGKAVGEIKAAMEVYPQQWNMGYNAELIGYTHGDNIQSATIIENALEDVLASLSDSRSVDQLQSIISQFDMEMTDQFNGYTIYYNYENWIDDPSPMWRIGLVFKENKLTSILHSRPIEVSGTTDHRLGRAFDCMVYNDVAGADDIVGMFRQFVHSVD